MNRQRIADIVAGLTIALLFATLWVIAYEIVCGLRWRAAEGGTKWALIQRQLHFRDGSSLTPEFFWFGPDHFYRRLMYPPMRAEALARAGVAAGALFAIAGALIIAYFATRPVKHKGDARWGDIGDAAKASLTVKKGILFGKLNGILLRSDAPAHILVVGPSRSGKGTSFLLPNGYDHVGSSVWWDVKRENYDLLARFLRDRGSKVFIFNPGATHSHRYNPLDFIRGGPHMPTDCGTAASFIIPERADDTWSGAGRMLLSALIGYVMSSQNCRGQRHLRSVARMTVTGKDISAVLRSLVATEGAMLPNWVCDGFNQYVALEPETRNSAVFNINMAMNPWNNPLISAVTETSDFDIRHLREERIAIFVVCGIAELVQFRPIIRILFQQIHDLMMMERPKVKDRYEVLLALDEFRHLGPMPQLLSMLTISAGYKFRMAIVIQSISMLDELYGKPVRQTTLAGSQVKLFIKIDDLDTANYVSEMLGDRTIKVETPGQRIGTGLFASRSKQTHFEAQPLMSAPDLRLLSFGKSILFVSGARPFLIDKVQHYRDQPFKGFLGRYGDMKASPPMLGKWTDGDIGPLLQGQGRRSEPKKTAEEDLKPIDEMTVSSTAPLDGGTLNVAEALRPREPSTTNESLAPIVGGAAPSKPSAPRRRQLSPALPVKGVVRDYPAPVVVEAARSESDMAFRDVVAPVAAANGLALLTGTLTGLNTAFGQAGAEGGSIDSSL